jgi:TldD protein
MGIRRRELLIGGGLAAVAAACTARRDVIAGATSGASVAALDDVLARALDAAKRAGASYADARVVRRQWEGLWTREDHVVGVEYDERFGIGVRVLVNGAWGYASSSNADPTSAEDAARRAVTAGRANARANDRPVELAPTPAVRDSWRTPFTRDPFDVPIDEKAAWLLALWADARNVPGIKYAESSVESLGEWKIYMSTEGSRIEQSVMRIAPAFHATAVDAASGDFDEVQSDVAPMQGGWEYVTGSPLRADARRIAEDAVRKLRAPSVAPGKRDVILAPSNLWLTIHESAGHSTELDRAMGAEANMAGTSFLLPEMAGKLRFGAPIVTIYADKTTPGGLATCGWDDDGVKTQRWDLVKDGVFVAYQTTREQAKWVGEKASRGTSYAEDHASFPFQRMPNVSLKPAEKEVTLEDIVAATDDGIYAVGDASWSIDHQRRNFQFGSQMAYEVKKGKIAGPVRHFAYQSSTVEFWNACDMIGGAKSWRLNGTLHDGKGEPMQNNAVSHGCPPARFRAVNVLDSRGKKAST